MMPYHCSTTNTAGHTSCCLQPCVTVLDLLNWICSTLSVFTLHATDLLPVPIHMIWSDGGKKSNQVWQRMWEVFFFFLLLSLLMMNVMVDIMKASILISRCKSGLFGLLILESMLAFGFRTVVLWLTNWVFLLQTADVRLEEFVYEKLEKKVPTRMNNHELLGQSMIESGNEFGPGTAYGEWHTEPPDQPERNRPINPCWFLVNCGCTITDFSQSVYLQKKLCIPELSATTLYANLCLLKSQLFRLQRRRHHCKISRLLCYCCWSFVCAAEHFRKRSDKMWRDGETDWWGRAGVPPKCCHQLPDTFQKLSRGRLQNHPGELDPECCGPVSLLAGLWPYIWN